VFSELLPSTSLTSESFSLFPAFVSGIVYLHFEPGLTTSILYTVAGSRSLKIYLPFASVVVVLTTSPSSLRRFTITPAIPISPESCFPSLAVESEALSSYQTKSPKAAGR
jgi:hypothetical protein